MDKLKMEEFIINNKYDKVSKPFKKKKTYIRDKITFETLENTLREGEVLLK